MKTIKFTAEIVWPAPKDFDAGKVVAFRPPKKGDKYLTSDAGVVATATSDWDDDRHCYRPIIDDWQWPEWLTAAAVVMLPSGGRWVATECIPVICDSAWDMCGVVFDLSLTSFVPPPCDDWRKSWRINPRFQ